MSTATLQRPREPVVDDVSPLPRLLLAAAGALLALVPVVVTALLGAGALLREARLVDLVEGAGTGTLSGERVAAAEEIVAWSANLALTCYLSAGLLFAVWLRTAWRTAYALGVRDLRYGPGWALAGWIVPIMNLWVPKRIVDDVWSAGTGDIRYDRKSRLVLLWWSAFLVAAVGARLARVQDVPARLLTALFLFDVVVSVLGAAVVVAVTARLMGRADRSRRPLPGRSLLPRVSVPLGPGAALAAAAAALAVAGGLVAVRGTAELPPGLTAAPAAAASAEQPSDAAPSETPVDRLPVLVEAEGFTIAMPGRPLREEAPETEEEYASVIYSYETGSGDDLRAYVVSVFQIAPGDVPTEEGLDAEQLLTDVLQGIAEENQGLGSPVTSGTLQGRAWREALVTTDFGSLRIRVLLDGDQVVQVAAGPQRPEGTTAPQDVFTPFVATLRFTD